MNQKRILTLCLAALTLTAALAPAAWAGAVCYPVSVTRSDDGREIRKVYDLGPEEDPAGIPRSDFDQEGFHYTLTDLLRQEQPEYEERPHTETVSLPSKSKDMQSVLSLLPQEKEFVTDDGLSGTLTLDLSSVRVEVSGYGSSTKAISATRTYPSLDSQDTANIPKSITEGGNTLTLQNVTWQTSASSSVDGYALGERFTATATYSGSRTSSYVKGYTVTADYSGTVSRIALDKVRYVAIFEGTPIQPPEPETPEVPEVHPARFNWLWVGIPLGAIALGGAGIGTALLLRRRRESEESEDTEE